MNSASIVLRRHMALHFMGPVNGVSFRSGGGVGEGEGEGGNPPAARQRQNAGIAVHHRCVRLGNPEPAPVLHFPHQWWWEHIALLSAKHANAGMGGTPRGRSSTWEQRDGRRPLSITKSTFPPRLGTSNANNSLQKNSNRCVHLEVPTATITQLLCPLAIRTHGRSP